MIIVPLFQGKLEVLRDNRRISFCIKSLIILVVVTFTRQAIAGAECLSFIAGSAVDIGGGVKIGAGVAFQEQYGSRTYLPDNFVALESDGTTVEATAVRGVITNQQVSGNVTKPRFSVFVQGQTSAYLEGAYRDLRLTFAVTNVKMVRKKRNGQIIKKLVGKVAVQVEDTYTGEILLSKTKKRFDKRSAFEYQWKRTPFCGSNQPGGGKK
jgi:hypothetical protein